MRKKRLWIGILVLAVVITAVSGWLIYENRLDQAQQDALAELDRNVGLYDAQSIVLQNTSKAKARALAELYGAKLRITENGRFATLTLPEGTTIRDIYALEEGRQYIDDMAADYQVQVSNLIEEEGSGERLPSRPQYNVSDTDYELQTYLNYLNLGNTWIDYDGEGVTVAVIDTGIDTDHPEFSGRISEYSYNATEDKIVKDYNDWSLIEDEQGHGTAVAGVIAASMYSDNVVGIAPKAEILVIKVECDKDGRFTRTSDLVFGLYYAIEQDAKIVNMSFSTYSYENPFAEATQLAVDSDIICVAAAGNNRTSAFCWPAADENVIGVGALATDSWSLASYSNYGENTKLVAPGTTYTTQMGGGYGITSGTSMSSPIVAGAIALLTQYDSYMTYEEVTELLYASSYDLGDLGRDVYYGFGALDIYALTRDDRGTVTFDMLTDELDNIEAKFIQGHALQELPEPERLYAVFDGWYYDQTFTQEYNYYEDKLYDNVTLYAKWVNEDDGIPFTYTTLNDGTIEITSYTGRRRYITIPAMIEGKLVSSIGEGAFANQSRLRGVTLPEGIVNIGDNAFAYCNYLVSMEIPSTVIQIGADAFFQNTRLRTVVFSGTSRLESVGYRAFSNSGLDRIELPASLNSIGGSAFSGAANLYEIKVQAGNASYKSIDGVLMSKDGSTLVAFPAAWGSHYELPAGVTRIGAYAFAYAGLRTISLDGVQSLEESAFMCAALESVTIPESVVSIGNECFSGDSWLSSVTIQANIQTIPFACFRHCSALTSVHIPASVSAIESYAFDSSGLKKVTFDPNTVLATIGGYAFSCNQLSEIEVPASVETIGECAFAGSAVTYIKFSAESKLRFIGKQAFASCRLLETVELPAGLQTIGSMAFAESGLSAIYIPAAVAQIGDGAFASCSALSAITVAAENTVYQDIGGVLYNKAGTTIHAYPCGRTDSSYSLEETTQNIAPYAFTGEKELRSVWLGQSLVEIEEYAFYSCHGLSSLSIPSNVSLIGRYAFADCMNLSSVSFDMNSKLSRISYGTFAGSGIYGIRIPANISSIGQDAFWGCTRLTNVIFSENSKLENISAYMFNGCSNLKSIKFEAGSSLKSIQAHGLEGIRKLTEVDFGDAKLENIDNFAFRFCESLSQLQLPQTVKSVGRYAFYGCKSMSSLTLPANIEHIGSYAFLQTGDLELYLLSEVLPVYLEENWDRGVKGYFTGVSAIKESGDFRYAVLASGNIAILEYLGDASYVDLTQINLGGNITVIGGSAFANSNISAVVLPNSLTQIQAEAFFRAPLQSIEIPANVTFIGREAFADTDIQTLTFASGSKLSVVEQYAFEGTKNLKTVMLPASLTTMGTGVFLDSGLQSVAFASGIGITEIPQKAFAETKLTSVALPDSVTLVNHNAFSNVQTLKSVSFGSNAGIRLMSNAFYHTGLESLHIPANVTYIGEYCFVALPNLKTFSVDAANPNYAAVDGLLFSKDGRKLVAVPAGRTGSLTVPLSVEEIGFGAFEESRLSEVKFHENANILSLGYRAFFKAENITTITIPKSVMAIDYYAFAYCENLKEVIFAEDNQLSGIYEGAFCGDINLESILLPDSVVEISDWAFFGCTKINDIPVSDNSALTGIYSYAFAYAGLNGTFTVPETVVDIGDYAFLGNKFTSVTIPDAKQQDLIIGIGAFEDCNQLLEITVPFVGASFEDKDISWFGYIFGAGSYEASSVYIPKSLQSIYLTEGVTTLYRGAFYEVNAANLHLPHSVSVLHEDSFHRCTSRYELTNTITTVGDFYYTPDGNDDHTVCAEYSALYSHFGENIYGTVRLADGVQAVDSAFANCRSLEVVILPDSVEILFWPFTDASSLRSVTLPSGLNKIPDSCFEGCASLREIELPEQVTFIGEEAFAGSGIRSCRIPDGITQIPTAAFKNCASLTQVTLPDNLTSIGAEAFCNTGLVKIELPASLQTIEDGAFTGCLWLAEVINNSDLPLSIGSTEYGAVAEHANTIVDKDGNTISRGSEPGWEMVITDDLFCFRKDGSDYTLVAYLGEEADITLPENIKGKSYSIERFCGGVHVTIPSNIKSIGKNAFDGNTTIQSITAEGLLEEIGESAFHDCESLTTVSFTKGVKSIDTLAFSNCSKLSAVNLGKGMEIIGWAAFAYCDSLTTVTLPEGLLEIEDMAFYSSGISSITIPSSVKTIGAGVFDATPLKDMVIASGNKYFSSSAGVLYNKAKTQIIWASKEITSVTIPATVTDIESAFYDCVKLETVVFESGSKLKEIGYDAFYNCESLKSITLPSGITEIKSGAFQGSGLESITLPKSLKILNLTAFAYTNIESMLIPAGVTSIGGYTYDNTPGIEKFLVEAGNSYYTAVDGVLYNKKKTEIIAVPGNIAGEITIPEGVTSIGKRFSYCVDLEEIHLPSTLKVIDDYAFDNCESLKSIVIPDGITKIGVCAFLGCTSLSNVVLPDGLTEIADSAFSNCYSLFTIDLPDSITRIGTWAFSDCVNLFEIYLPAGVTTIEKGTFTRTGLATITIPSHITLIEEDAFFDCKIYEIINQSDLDIQLGSWDHGAIAIYAISIVDKHGNRTYLEGSEDFEIIDQNDFRFAKINGEYLLLGYIGREDTITLPTMVNGEPCWPYYFKGGVNVIIPEGVTEIPGYAFCDARSLKTVSIPNTVTRIGTAAFAGCEALMRVIIPDSVTDIEGIAFSGCESLIDIQLPDTAMRIEDGAFTSTGYASNKDNWEDGYLYIGNHLIVADQDATILLLPDNIKSVADDTFEGCHQLRVLRLNSVTYGMLSDVTNLETLILMDTSTSLGEAFRWSYPLTLKNIVLPAGTNWNLNNFGNFIGALSGCTIWIEEEEEDLRLDDNFQGWNNGNKVIYSDSWVWAYFYDQNGELIRVTPQPTYTVIRLPYVEAPEGGEDYSYEFTGWDIDGDGEADSIPATSTVDIHAHAVIKKVEKQYSIVFMDKETGTIYHQLKAPKGAYIYAPPAPTKEDATFLGWGNYGDYFRVTGDMTIYAEWHYHSYESSATAPTCETQGYTTHTCTECGFQKKDTYIDPIGHSFTQYVSDGNGTCQNDGTKTASCDHGCGKTDTVADPGSKTDHQYGDWIVIKPSTETEEGLKRRECKHCDHFEEVVTPIWVGPEAITSDVFEIGEGTVSKISAGTTVADFLNGINEGEFVKVFKDGQEVASDTVIGTGMEVQLIVGDEVVQTLTIVVTGDVSGDGAITITDMLAVKSHVLKKSTLEGAYFEAGDTSGDGAISITDFIQIKAQILGKGGIVPHGAERAPVAAVMAVGDTQIPNSEESAENAPLRPVAALMPDRRKR